MDFPPSFCSDLLCFKKSYRAERDKIVRCQALYRANLAKKKAEKVSKDVIRLQAVCRMLVRRGKWRRLRRGIFAAQRNARAKFAVSIYKEILERLGAEERARMEAAEKERQRLAKEEAERAKEEEERKAKEEAELRAKEKMSADEARKFEEEQERARLEAEEKRAKEEARKKQMAEERAKLDALGMGDDIDALKAAIVATGGAEEGNNEVLEADDDAIGAASGAGLGSGEKNWGELVQNMPLGDDDDETDLGPDGLPRLSLLLPKDGNNLPDPLNDPPPPLPVLQLHLVAAASSSEADEYAVGDYVEALNYMVKRKLEKFGF